MTVLTVKAQDTATAMEEIVEKLGKDSFIIGTRKIGNEILVKATNTPKKMVQSKKNVNENFPPNFLGVAKKQLSRQCSRDN